MSSNEPAVYGSMEVGKSGEVSNTVSYDKIAVLSGRLFLASVIGDFNVIKAMRALLAGAGGKQTRIVAGGGLVSRPKPEGYKGYYWGDSNPTSPGQLFACPGGYNCYVHKLDYGLAHAMFITREDGFMPVISQDSLWQQLNETRFTTPILREWLPVIETELRDKQLLSNALCFNCTCGVLNASTEDLDKVVTEGLKDGTLTIPRKAAS